MNYSYWLKLYLGKVCRSLVQISVHHRKYGTLFLLYPGPISWPTVHLHSQLTEVSWAPQLHCSASGSWCLNIWWQLSSISYPCYQGGSLESAPRLTCSSFESTLEDPRNGSRSLLQFHHSRWKSWLPSHRYYLGHCLSSLRVGWPPGQSCTLPPVLLVSSLCVMTWLHDNWQVIWFTRRCYSIWALANTLVP